MPNVSPLFIMMMTTLTVTWGFALAQLISVRKELRRDAARVATRDELPVRIRQGRS